MGSRTISARFTATLSALLGIAHAQPGTFQNGEVPEVDDRDPAMLAARPKLLACYEAATKHAPELPAELTITISLRADASGKPSNVRVEPSSRCMIDVVNTLRFAKSKTAERTFTLHVKDERSAADRAAGRPSWMPPAESGYGVSSAPSRGATRAPIVTIGEPVVRGPLSRAIVKRHVKRAISKLTYCYEKQLLVAPKLRGFVKLAFAIDKEGNVESATATGLGNTEVEACMQSALLSTQFPKPTAPVEASVALTLRPGR